MRPSIDSCYERDKTYRDILILKSPERRQFLLEGVRPFILHNNGLFFCFQVFLLSFWLINYLLERYCKRELIQKLSGSIQKIFVYTVFGVVLYLSFFPNLVFASINIRQTKFNHFYFVICFLISLLYLGVFVFYIYIAMFGMLKYQKLPHNLSQKFFLFLVNLKKEKMSHNWDLV